MSRNVYLAGAMTNVSLEDSEVWRHDFEQWISEIDNYWGVMNPCEHFSAHSVFPVDEREAMRHDLWMLKNSDLVICDMDNQNSLGTSAELGIAYDRGIPVIGICSKEHRETLHPWWENIALVICENIEDAKMYFVDHFINVY